MNDTCICLSVKKKKSKWKKKKKCIIVAAISLTWNVWDRYLINSLHFYFFVGPDTWLWVRLVITTTRKTVVVNKLPDEHGDVLNRFRKWKKFFDAVWYELHTLLFSEEAKAERRNTAEV